MSAASSTLEHEETALQSLIGQTTSRSKPQRALACLQCSQRKVKCNRKFPCTNCVRQGAQCVPTLAPRQRRRRFPERDLLDHLRYYENLLRQNHVDFEPLHRPISTLAAPTAHSSPSGSLGDSDAPTEDYQPKEKTVVKSKPAVSPRDLLRAINRVTLDDDSRDEYSDTGESDTGDQPSDFLLLFGLREANVHLSASHPDQVHIFRLWQIYLENVNPLLKIIHTPTLQPRIIDAVSDLSNINPTLEALIFSIYCVSVNSLSDNECRGLFGTPRRVLLAGYRSACVQALLKCKALEQSKHSKGEGLTALYHYMISSGSQSQTDPDYLSSMAAVAIRIAQRMEMHDESSYAEYTALEAEMRRRLWWSLVVFDNRISEMSGYKTTSLVPIWDCSTPLNVNDFEIRKEMRPSPRHRSEPTEALFAVVRSELADFLRHSAFHLGFINPALNAIAKPTATTLDTLEKTIEDKYLAFCDLEDPLHFMTVWTARAQIARMRLLDYYAQHSASSSQQTDAQRNQAVSYALKMLECDTKLSTSPLTKGYLWLADFHVPGLAYNQILHDLRKRPTEDYAEKAWAVMSENYEARTTRSEPQWPSALTFFSRVVLQTWAVREALFQPQDEPLEPPRIVSNIRNKMPQLNSTFLSNMNRERVNMDQAPMPTELDFGGYGTGTQYLAPGNYPGTPGEAMMTVDVDPFLTSMDWTLMHAQGW